MVSVPVRGKPAVAIVTLGCPKNQVDSEAMAALLTSAGYRTVGDTRQASVVIVNTCGFLSSAETESHQVIDGLASDKQGDQLLIVAGCMAERRGAALVAANPRIDGVIGTNRWGEIVEYVASLRSGGHGVRVGPALEWPVARRYADGPSAYIKISDGCDVGCAFCTIPLFKGRLRSKPADAIVAEARELVSQGVREIVLIGQDTTAYGSDLGVKDGLASLLERLCAEDIDFPWLRVMYAFPTRVTPRLLDVMARHSRIVKYVDLPLQHASPEVLSRMGRPRQDPREVVDRLRSSVPGIAIRSTFIVGFPGETEAEFNDLLGFLEYAKLERAGAFAYSAEDGTVAAGLPDQIPEATKLDRLDRVMRLQQRISLARNRELVGQTMSVLTEAVANPSGEAKARKCKSTGRSYRDAPEVDGVVYIRESVPIGTIARVRITDALDYDLVGRLDRGSRVL